MQIKIVPVQWPVDREDAIDFLTSNDWPYHGSPALDRNQAGTVELVSESTSSFWLELTETRVGLVRVFDLEDLEAGSPLLDVRIATAHRNRGLGRHAVDWITRYLFMTHRSLYRIEATTRHDNDAMKKVLYRCGYRQEGRMIEAWRSSNGERFDTLVFAILRREWEGTDTT